MDEPKLIVVQKYGGSSMADVDRIHEVADRVVATCADGHQVVVVVSAMGNTTDELAALAKKVSANPGRRELDLLISVGERVSMTLLAMAIEDRGIPAASFTGSQSGIITDENHVAAQVIEVRPHRIEQALESGRVAIVAGFQGVSRAGEVTTLGRGGSDTTAVVLAAALGAEHCEICSDVDAVYTGDPRVVDGATPLESLSLGGVLALAQAGSRVLLSDAVEHARRLGVTLRVAGTSRPPGTGTSHPPGPAPHSVTAVTSNGQLEYVVASKPAELEACIGALRGWAALDGRLHALVDLRNLPNGTELDRIEADSRRRVATVSAIGRRSVTDPSVVQAAVDALRPHGLDWWFGSGDTWTGVVPRDSADAAQRALHAALIEG